MGPLTRTVPSWPARVAVNQLRRILNTCKCTEKSCNMCSGTSSGACCDTTEKKQYSCDTLKTWGSCDKTNQNYGYMSAYCRKTCGICTASSSTGSTTTTTT